MKSDLEKLAYKIGKFLEKNNCTSDSSIYFEGKRLKYKNDTWEIEDGLKASQYIEKANDDTISMVFEGPFYGVINGSGDPFINEESIQNKFQKLLDKHGYYYEQHDSWNLSLYKIED